RFLTRMPWPPESGVLGIAAAPADRLNSGRPIRSARTSDSCKRRTLSSQILDATDPPGPHEIAQQQAEQADHGDKYERAAPGLGVPILVRGNGIVVDLDGQGGHRLQQVSAKELIA